MSELRLAPTAPAGTAATSLATTRNAFDALRLLAAVIVVFQHGNADLSTNALWNIAGPLDGVAMFFVLSGFLVFSSADNIVARGRSWRTFFANRYLRIAPALYVFAVAAPLSLVALGTVPASALASLPFAAWLGSFAVLLPNFKPEFFAHLGSGSINGPLYTIPAEVSFYLVIPLIFVAIRTWGFWPTIAGLAIVSTAGSVASNLLGGGVASVLHHTFLERGAYFTVGIVLARYWRRIPLRWWLALVALALVLGLLLLGPQPLFVPVYGPLKPLLLAGPLAYVLLYAGLRAPRVFTGLTARIGDLSYGTYIWHAFVIAVLAWFGIEGSWGPVFLLLGVSLGLAALSWFFVEKPALRLKRVRLRAA
ncbi:MAG: hypothetical protein JWP75_2505 [Frondihabitans sp.]|nr:hypothetical protein [Frondihabitans sp.]